MLHGLSIGEISNQTLTFQILFRQSDGRALNNARIGDANAYSIAVSIPIGSDVNGAQEILRGVAQAQIQVNQAGGIDGVPLC